MDFLKTKNSYLTSIFIVVIVIAIVIFIWSKIESFENEEDDIEIKTQQCKDCKLQGNKFNSFLEIYKRSFNNRRFNN